MKRKICEVDDKEIEFFEDKKMVNKLFKYVTNILPHSKDQSSIYYNLGNFSERMHCFDILSKIKTIPFENNIFKIIIKYLEIEDLINFCLVCSKFYNLSIDLLKIKIENLEKVRIRRNKIKSVYNHKNLKELDCCSYYPFIFWNDDINCDDLNNFIYSVIKDKISEIESDRIKFDEIKIIFPNFEIANNFVFELIEKRDDFIPKKMNLDTYLYYKDVFYDDIYILKITISNKFIINGDYRYLQFK